jgi:hypothetical protein
MATAPLYQLDAKNAQPAVAAVAVATADADLPTYPTRALWVGTAGNLSLVLADGGTAVTIKNVANGTLLPFSVKQVKAATTAADIVALY